jgi:hypothetical protein
MPGLRLAQVELGENPMRRTWSPRLGVFGLCLVWSASAHADPMTLGWAQPGGPGSPVTITYSYSNLFDGGFNTSLATAELRRSTEEALAIWGRYAPLNFVETLDSGPVMSTRRTTRTSASAISRRSVRRPRLSPISPWIGRAQKRRDSRATSSSAMT